MLGSGCVAREVFEVEGVERRELRTESESGVEPRGWPSGEPEAEESRTSLNGSVMSCQTAW